MNQGVFQVAHVWTWIREWHIHAKGATGESLESWA